MSTIHDTVVDYLTEHGMSSYVGSAQPVIAALVDRERGIAEQLLDVAADQGLDYEESRDTLSRLGMAVPQPEPQPQPASNTDGNGSLPELVAELTRRVDELTRLAQRHGLIG